MKKGRGYKTILFLILKGIGCPYGGRQKVFCPNKHVLWSTLDWRAFKIAKNFQFISTRKLASNRSEFHDSSLGAKCVCLQPCSVWNLGMSSKTLWSMDCGEERPIL